jgi:hypothetical protein
VPTSVSEKSRSASSRTTPTAAKARIRRQGESAQAPG